MLPFCPTTACCPTFAVCEAVSRQSVVLGVQSDSFREENGSLRRQCLEYESQAAALQNEAAEHVRTISAGNVQVKLLQSKVRLVAALHAITDLTVRLCECC